MDLSDALQVALSSLYANKLRTALTMLGLTIGVGAVIALMSIGQGAQAAVATQFNTLGTNLVFVTPGTTSSGGVRAQAGSVNTLTYDDATAAADPNNVPDATLVSPELSTFGQLIFQSQNTVGRVYGVTAEYPQAHNYEISQGAWFTDDQVQGNANVVILGATVAQQLFPGGSPIGQELRINAGGGAGGARAVLAQIIGIGVAKGGSGADNPDSAVYVPITTALDKLSRSTTGAGAEAINQITVQAASAKQTSAVEQELTALLMQRHHISDPTQIDFSVTSQQDQEQTQEQVTSVLTIFLGAVAGIALLVGGIGIMNIMIVSVTERTHEIGLRKAVGARHMDIVIQFLVESSILSALGGLGGIVIGVVVSRIVNGMQFNGQALQTLVTLQSILLAAGVSIAIGMFFGIYPAEKAAQMHPIDALHYE